MSNQEILPEPIPRPGEQIAKPTEIDSSYNEEKNSKMIESQPATNAGGAALSGVHVSSAQGQVGGVVQGNTQGASSTNQALTSSATAQLSADDLDLIEKEWVKKAKEIVEATQNEPHVQSDELSKVKADYIKKRYGKDVRVKES